MWRLWAVLEGLAKTASAVFQKKVGVVMGTLEMGCVAAALIGIVQMASGLIWWGRKSIRDPKLVATLVPDVWSVACLVFIGLISGIFGTVLSIYTFTLGADMGVRTLLISASILPASIVAAIIWPKTDGLGARQWAGIAVFLVAMWVMLGSPNLGQIFSLQMWVWVVLLLALTNGLTELLSRVMALKVDAWVNNFWVGASTTFFSLTLLVILGLVYGGVNLSLSSAFLGGVVVIGMIVVAMITFKVWTYQGGGTIALKKIIMPGTYLFTSILAGAALYGEPLTFEKFLGAVLWVVSIALTDKKAALDLLNLGRAPQAQKTA